MAKYKKRADGNYEAKISCGYDDSGKRIRVSVYAKSIRDLEEKILIIKMDMKKNGSIKTSDMSLYDYSVAWFNTYKATRSINTKAMYNNVIEKHIKEDIGHIPISKVTKSDIQGMINYRSENYETCHKILLTLKQIFNSAIEDELISKNPAANIAMPAKPKTEKRALTKQEKQAIQTAELSDMDKAFIYVIYYCGLRREEALALTKNNLDFKRNLISIRNAIVFDGNTPVIAATKNESSVRDVPIPIEAVGFLKEYSSNCRPLYLFTKQDGTLITKSSYRKMWERIVFNLNMALLTPKQIETYNSLPKALKKDFMPIKDLTAHIFRHNYITMLYYSGISIKKAAQLVGHANTNMIMKVYAHLDEEKEQTIEKLNLNIKLG